MTKQRFGGFWTEDKLSRVSKYLKAYTTVLKKQTFNTFYIDAFAGTGYNNIKQKNPNYDPNFPQLASKHIDKFIEGSARIALQTIPRFNNYIFVETKTTSIAELKKLKEEQPIELQGNIKIEQEDANTYIKRFCQGMGGFERAVLFLDPYGMAVKWETVEAIAATKHIDLWYLFPIGMGVNRLLKRDGNINELWKQKLDDLFGTTEWFDAFYHPYQQENIFGQQIHFKMTDSISKITQYVLQRFATIFPIEGIAQNPLILKNEEGSPLFLLCFAAGNALNAPQAVEIAEYILNEKDPPLAVQGKFF